MRSVISVFMCVGVRVGVCSPHRLEDEQNEAPILWLDLAGKMTQKFPWS